MFVHTVYFWLKPSLTAEQRMTFVDGLKSLISIKTVRFGHFGKPADTDRPIIEPNRSVSDSSISTESPSGSNRSRVPPSATWVPGWM
mgnify:CR=1 FL=1